jgi:ribosomal-protein-alanine N-acetyltransferase
MLILMFPDSFHTARLLLRPVAPTDAGPIFDGYAQDRAVSRFLTWAPHRSLGETDAYIARCAATPPEIARTYVLVDRETQRVRGALDLRQASAHRVEFGYVLARRYWGQGLMTEALTEVVAWALTQSSVFRVGSVCDAENIGSARDGESRPDPRGFAVPVARSPESRRRAAGLFQLCPCTMTACPGSTEAMVHPPPMPVGQTGTICPARPIY